MGYRKGTMYGAKTMIKGKEWNFRLHKFEASFGEVGMRKSGGSDNVVDVDAYSSLEEEAGIK